MSIALFLKVPKFFFIIWGRLNEEIKDQVGYRQAALPIRTRGTGPPRTRFLNVGPPKGQYFFGPFFKDDVSPLGPMYGPYKGW